MKPNIEMFVKQVISRLACGSLLRGVLSGFGALLLSIVCAGMLAAQGNTVNITVEGLPGGLQVAVLEVRYHYEQWSTSAISAQPQWRRRQIVRLACVQPALR